MRTRDEDHRNPCNGLFQPRLLHEPLITPLKPRRSFPLHPAIRRGMLTEQAHGKLRNHEGTPMPLTPREIVIRNIECRCDERIGFNFDAAAAMISPARRHHGIERPVWTKGMSSTRPTSGAMSGTASSACRRAARSASRCSRSGRSSMRWRSPTWTTPPTTGARANWPPRAPTPSSSAGCRAGLSPSAATCAGWRSTSWT